MSQSSSSWPIDSQLPSEIAFLANPISSYFNANPPYNNASLGALIFSPLLQPPSLLLVQVCQNTDPHAFSGAWEVPSGAPQPQDLTMLHSLARIILEQTGLHLSRVHSMSGSEAGPGTLEQGDARWMKLQFTVHVSELASDATDSPQLERAYGDGAHEGSGLTSLTRQAIDLNAVPVTLDQGKYQRHAWVTENDLQEFANSGLFPVEQTKQYQSMLDAFSLYTQRNVRPQDDLLIPDPNLTQVQSSSLDSALSTSPANGYSPPGSMKPPSKVDKTTLKKKGAKVDKARPSPSHFHRFRIS